MKKIIYFSIVLLSTILFSCGNDKESVNDTKAFTQEQIVTESKKANDFFDRVYNEFRPSKREIYASASFLFAIV